MSHLSNNYLVTASEKQVVKKTLGLSAIGLLLFACFVSSAYGQVQPPVGVIDFYGLRAVSKESVREALGVKEGDTLTLTADSLESRLTQLEGVMSASVTKICCVEGRQVLFVGVQEKMAEGYPWKKVEGAKIYLPRVLTNKYASFLTALKVAVSKGDNGDDLSAGHSLFRNPALKKIQQAFIPPADKHFNVLANVLQHSVVEGQREAAATIIAYATDKQKVADQYYEALTDPSPAVRNNVFRALAGLGVYATAHPKFRLRLSADLFVWMLNSLYWSDRDKALFSLVAITEKRDSVFLRQLKTGALSALVEMAAWKSKGHAVLAYILLGRMANVPEEAIFSSWNEGRNETVLQRLED